MTQTAVLGSSPTGTRIKGKADAPNYRPVGAASLQRCDTCAFFQNGKCSKYNFQAAATAVCDGWRPNVGRLRDARQQASPPRGQQSSKEAGAVPTGTPGHGPGGLFSHPGLGGKKKKEDEEEDTAVVNAAVTKEETSRPASTQLPMPSVVKAKALALGRMIDPADLTEDGLEKEPHVTVKFGIVPDIGAVRAIARRFGPITLKFGGLSLFTKEDADVLKVEVDSPELRRLNEALSAIPNTDERPLYHPHMTIAYLKPGAGRKYVGDGPFYGRTVTVDTLEFSESNESPDGANEYHITAVPLGEDSTVKVSGGKGTARREPADTAVDLGRSGRDAVSFPPSRTMTAVNNPRLRGDDGRHGDTLSGGNMTLLERAKHLMGGHNQAAHQRFHQTADMVDSLMKLPAAARQAAIAALGEDVQTAVKTEMAARTSGTRLQPTTKEQGSFSVFKQADGRYRWASISSNAYRDRDGEIVSQKALENDVMRADVDGDYGPLRFWHMPGADIGQADFNAMHGRFLIESGTFADEEIAQAVASRAKEYQISIGFRHPKDNPDSNGVFHFIRRFERSLVPAGRAANPFTSLLVKEPTMQDEKVKEFERLLGPERVKGILGTADTAEKQATEWGTAFKELNGGDLNVLAQDPTALLDFAIKQYEAFEAAEAEKAAKADDKEEAEDEAEDGPMAKMYKMMGDITTKMEAMYKMLEGNTATKETAVPAPVTDALDALKESDQIQAERLNTAEARVKELTDKLQLALKELKVVQATVGEAPRGVAEGFRPTAAAETVKEGAEAVKEADPNASNPYGSFLGWVAAPAGAGNGAFPTQTG